VNAKAQQTAPPKGDIAEKQKTSIAVVDYGEDAGAGFEGVSQTDLVIPFLEVLQAQSKKLEGADGSKAGDVLNTVTNEFHKGAEGFAFIPVHAQHLYVEWKPRDDGGGFVGKHEVDSDVVKKAVAASEKFGEYKTEDGNDLVETYYLYLIALKADGTTEYAVVAFTSMKVKVYKNFITKAKMVQVVLGDGRRINPPLFAHVYRAKTVSETKDGFKYHNFQPIAFDKGDAASSRLSPEDALYQDAKVFGQMIRQGAVKTAEASSERPTAKDAKAVF
jgi:hypothetical protein